MKILLINCFAESKSGNGGYKILYDLLLNALHKCKDIIGPGSTDIVSKRLNELDDFLVDWEYDVLGPNSCHNAKRFDKVDIICVGGDMKILPWESSCQQLILLLHMAEVMRKPVFCCGSGAFAAVYSAATQGVRFNIINDRLGDPIEKLAAFPKFAKGTRANPCGWFDNETGDIYSFNKFTQNWQALCNVGIYRNASTGAPTLSRHRPKSKVLSREDRMTSFENHLPSTLDDHEYLAHIRNEFLHHYSFVGINNASFVVSLLPDWYLNIDGALPLHSGLRVMADSVHGPVLLSMDNSLYLTSEITNNHSAVHLRTIFYNYFHHVITEIVETGHVGGSITSLLFSEGKNKEQIPAKGFSKALSTLPVRCSLSNGPTMLERQSSPLFKRQQTVDLFDNFELQNLGNTESQNFRKPSMSRKKRIEKLLLEQGQKRLLNLANLQFASPDPQKRIQITPADDKNDSNKVIEGSSKAQEHEDYREETGVQSAREPRSSILTKPKGTRPQSAQFVRKNSRLDWPSEWEDVRDVSSHKWRSNSKTISRLGDNSNNFFLPVNHPKISTKIAPETKHVNLKTPPARTYLKFQLSREFEDNEYQGAYREGYLSSHERQIKDYVKAKEKFIAGDFKRHVGPASFIPLRKEGAVRPHGIYPALPKYHKDSPDCIAGPWRPTNAKTNNSLSTM